MNDKHKRAFGCFSLQDPNDAEQCNLVAQLNAAIERYLDDFDLDTYDEENERRLCPGCKSTLSGNGLSSLLSSTFVWGLVHGEGYCSHCGWLCRAYHVPKHEGKPIIEDGEPVVNVLPYKSLELKEE